jgi:steroid delta-isomerase-like uncharacterized protein
VNSGKFILAASMLLALPACGKDADEAAAPAPTVASAPAPAPVAKATPAVTPAASLALLKNYLAAWNEHDADKAGSFMDGNVEYFDAAFAGMQNGKDAAVEHGIKVFLRGVPDLNWEIRSDPVASADGVAYEWTFTGTNTGTWGGVHATNQKIQLKGVGFIRIRDGKIIYQAVYYDSATLNRQLGL